MRVQHAALSEWACPGCAKWNPVTKAKCRTAGCPGEIQDAANWRSATVLTAKEEHFYDFTAPRMLRLLGKINHNLEELLKWTKKK